jgi:hypothetical protein
MSVLALLAAGSTLAAAGYISGSQGAIIAAD